MKRLIIFMTAPRPVEKRLDVFGDMVDHGICYQCKQWFPLHANFFHRNKSKKFGFHSNCKYCHNMKEMKRLQEENIETWFAKKACSARIRAKKKGIDFNLKFDDLEYPEFCPMTKKKLTYTVMTKDTYSLQRAEAASLDRIDSSEGYVAGNVRVVSWLYNHMKGPHSDAFVYEICKTIVDNNST